MNKIIKIIAVIFMMGSMTMNVKADVVIPPDDDFFNEHGDEINVWGYWHQAKRDVAIVEHPNSKNIIGVIEKDRVIRVIHLYEDERGVLWGAQNYEDTAIWFKMDDLPKYYANFDFCEDHQEEFKKTYYVPIYFEEDAWMIVWEYPGSDRISGVLHTSETRDKKYPLYEGQEYTDENGVRWTSIGYKGVSGWLNMEEIISYEKPEVKSVYLELDENFNPVDYPDLGKSFAELYAKEILTGGLVIGVSVLTGILAALKKKRG